MGLGGTKGFQFQMFQNAPENSPKQRLYLEHLAPDLQGTTFARDFDGLLNLLANKDVALYAGRGNLLHFPEHNCKYVLAWADPFLK